MGIFGSIISVIGTAAKAVAYIAGKVYSVGKILLPIISAFRQASPQVDAIVDKLEDVLEMGESQADDFLDQNVDLLYDMEAFGGDLQAAGAALKDVAETAMLFSQEETPDTITPAEAAILGAKIKTLGEALRDCFEPERLEDMEKKLQAIG